MFTTHGNVMLSASTYPDSPGNLSVQARARTDGRRSKQRSTIYIRIQHAVSYVRGLDWKFNCLLYGYFDTRNIQLDCWSYS